MAMRQNCASAEHAAETAKFADDSCVLTEYQRHIRDDGPPHNQSPRLGCAECRCRHRCCLQWCVVFDAEDPNPGTPCLCAAQTLRSDLQLGAVYIRVMQESTEDITAPWLLPEMVSRVADMLNYFLDHLAGLATQDSHMLAEPSLTPLGPICGRTEDVTVGQLNHSFRASAVVALSCGRTELWDTSSTKQHWSSHRANCVRTALDRRWPAWRPGPKRKNLRVRNPEKYQWKPAELLKQLARVYLNLSRADRAGDFVAAIAADQRSYHEGLFVEAAEVRGPAVGLRPC